MLDQNRTANRDPEADSPTLDRLDPGPNGGMNGSHRGLVEVDPWAYPTPQRSVREQRRRSLRLMTEALEVVALALIMFMGVRMVVHNYVVDGGSMEPTFENNQLVIVNRLAYSGFDLSWIPGVSTEEWRPFGQPDHGDVIVFTHQGNQPRDFIKRVIGLPGDTVEVRDGYVYINGEALDEPYVAGLANQDYGPEEVPPEHLFVLGDNRNNSFDSRVFGMVEHDDVIGRAELRYWPLGEIKLIDHTLGAPRLSLEVLPFPIPR